MYEFLSYAEHKGRYFEERLELLHHSIFFSTMEVNGAKQLFGSNHSSKYIFLLCSAEERNSYMILNM